MKTAHPMLRRAHRPTRRARRRSLHACAALGAVGLLLVLLAPGCAGAQKSSVPGATLISPYSGLDVIIAVAPLRNESGVSVVDVLDLSDTLVNTLQEAQGFSVLPLNRTLDAMRAAGIASIDTPAQAVALARAMGADAIVVGSLTAWHPYEPPRIGLNMALFGRSETLLRTGGGSIDPRELAASPTESRLAVFDPSRPLSVIAEHFDASDGGLRVEIRRYAEGRFDPRSSMGWMIYVKSMGHFSKFACFRAAALLLDAEAQRLGGSVGAPANAEGGGTAQQPPPTRER